ncbi:hypothetical protein CKM354_000340800 [Cercospora kikuchii]|uniref:BHLH domain-containing protein n=1 Tax=Cercospora kikuchii TaxID=84275 RepID=A0A9P3CBT1_9PEZI|nr:uncharacterized protein CKM354_000340800 [Cercospora kikuchii]GIZ40054.1 hypothetical protein CKM354_000340800 [Cercospora kikuchii]
MAASAHQDAMFVSPDNLVIDHQLDHGYGQHEPSPLPDTNPQHDQQNRSLPTALNGSRPSLSLPNFPEWNFAAQQNLRLSLPPTPNSPFRPLRPLTEEDKLAFPCPGGPQECWNLQLCPKHRQYPHTPPEPNNSGSVGQHTNASTTRTNSHSSTPPEQPSDPESRNKMKRPAIDPDDAIADNTNTRPSAYRTISRDSRASISRGRVPHNLVERRYRDNLNNQIESLRLTLPSLRDAQPCTGDYEDVSSPRMPSKAVIIQTAANYIQDLQGERSRLLEANKALQEQVSSLQKLVRCDESNVLQYINAMRLTAGQLPTPL